jgi:hypothetical protein
MSKQLQIKERTKEQYGKFALSGDSDSCCSPTKNCCGTKDNYLNAIRKAGFVDIEILDEKLYSKVEDENNSNVKSRKVSSITIIAYKA